MKQTRGKILYPFVDQEHQEDDVYIIDSCYKTIDSTEDTNSDRSLNNNIPEQLVAGADGSLREGGIVSLFSQSYVGILINYAAMGFVAGAMITSVQPFLKGYLNVRSYQASASSRLLTVAGSCKVIIGIISDSCPILGSRRRSYMVLGFVLCALSLWIASLFEVPDPFYVPGTTDILNQSAPNAGAKYTALMLIASIAYTFAEVATDAMTVEIAQREPMIMRGMAQTITSIVANFFAVLARTFTGTVLNGKAFGGSFDWYMRFDTMLMVLAVISLIPIPWILMYLKETQAPKEHFMVRLRAIWKLVQRRSIWQVLLFQFFAGFGWSFTSVSGLSIEIYLVKVLPVHRALIGIATGTIWCICCWFAYKFLLQANWKKTFIFSSILVLLVDFMVIFGTLFDVVRSQYFWLGARAFAAPGQTLRFLITIFPIVEIAELGHEGVTHALVTGFMSLPSAFSAVIYKAIDSYFEASDKHVVLDTPHVRNQVAYTYIIAYAFRLLSIGAVILLPAQRAATLRLRFYGGFSKVFGFLVVLLFFVSITFGIGINMLSLFESTACLRIAGGTGCNSA